MGVFFFFNEAPRGDFFLWKKGAYFVQSERFLNRTQSGPAKNEIQPLKRFYHRRFINHVTPYTCGGNEFVSLARFGLSCGGAGGEDSQRATKLNPPGISSGSLTQKSPDSDVNSKPS